MDALGEAAPAEDPQSEEGGFEEEGQEGLDSQRGAKDVADEAGVLGPVHAELELLHDAGGDAESEVNEKELAEETGCLQPVFLAGAVPRGLHDGDQQGQADRQRYEDEVVDGGDTELPSSDRDRVERCLREGHDGTFPCGDGGSKCPATRVLGPMSRADLNVAQKTEVKRLEGAMRDSFVTYVSDYFERLFP